ncbi:MAG: hypothetical protein ACPF8Y_01790 [Flavobacteriales bacterium]
MRIPSGFGLEKSSTSPRWWWVGCCLMLFIPCDGVAQDAQSALSGAESRMLDALLDRFQPLPSVERIWIGAFESAATRMEGIRLEVDSLERSGMDEAELLVQVGALRKELRVVRDDRNAFVGGFLSPFERLALDSILSPPKPSIQHFGFHDRMKCLVCKDPGALDVPPGIPAPTLKKN